MAYIFQYIHKKWKGRFLIKCIYILYHHDLAMLCFYPIFIVKYFNILFRTFFTPFCCCSIYILKVKFCFKYKSKTGYTHRKSSNENVSWIKKYKFNKKYFMLNIHFFCLHSFITEAVIYRNQSIDLRSKSMDWFVYDNGVRHERVKVWGLPLNGKVWYNEIIFIPYN